MRVKVKNYCPRSFQEDGLTSEVVAQFYLVWAVKSVINYRRVQRFFNREMDSPSLTNLLTFYSIVIRLRKKGCGFDK